MNLNEVNIEDNEHGTAETRRRGRARVHLERVSRCRTRTTPERLRSGNKTRRPAKHEAYDALIPEQ